MRDKAYREHISNIAYRFKFAVVYEEDSISVVKDGTITEIVNSDECSRDSMAWKAWRILAEQYDYCGWPKWNTTEEQQGWQSWIKED